jgi:hypothetical protein
MPVTTPLKTEARRRRPSAGNEEAGDDDRVGVTESGPLLDEPAHHRAHLHDFPGDEGAIFVPVDLLVHDRFSLTHADT